LIDVIAAWMDGSNSSATSVLGVYELRSQSGGKGTYPVSLRDPPRIPTERSLSSGEPKGTHWSPFLSRNNRLVVSSNRLVMCSMESAVPYLEFLSFSVPGEVRLGLVILDKPYLLRTLSPSD
jgi:hypothetical protein